VAQEEPGRLADGERRIERRGARSEEPASPPSVATPPVPTPTPTPPSATGELPPLDSAEDPSTISLPTAVTIEFDVPPPQELPRA
jgi:hypothetical protein